MRHSVKPWQFNSQTAKIAIRKSIASRRRNTALRRLAAAKTADQSRRPRLTSNHVYRILQDLAERQTKIEDRLRALEHAKPRVMSKRELQLAHMEAAYGPSLDPGPARKPAQPGSQPGSIAGTPRGLPRPIGPAADPGPIDHPS